MMIDAIEKAAGKLTSPALSYLYMDALKKIAEGKSTKIIFPMEITRLAEGIFSKLMVEKGAPVKPEKALKELPPEVDYSGVVKDLMDEYKKIYQKYVNKVKAKEMEKEGKE